MSQCDKRCIDQLMSLLLMIGYTCYPATAGHCVSYASHSLAKHHASRPLSTMSQCCTGAAGAINKATIRGLSVHPMGHMTTLLSIHNCGQTPTRSRLRTSASTFAQSQKLNDDICSDPEIQKHMALFCAGARCELFRVKIDSLYTGMMSNNKKLASFELSARLLLLTPQGRCALSHSSKVTQPTDWQPDPAMNNALPS